MNLGIFIALVFVALVAHYVTDEFYLWKAGERKTKYKNGKYLY